MTPTTHRTSLGGSAEGSRALGAFAQVVRWTLARGDCGRDRGWPPCALPPEGLFSPVHGGAHFGHGPTGDRREPAQHGLGLLGQAGLRFGGHL